MKARIRKLIITFACITTVMTGCGNKEIKEEMPEHVNIGVQTLVTPELLLREDGVYEKYLGTNVELLQFDSGADVSKALASGSIDIGVMGTSVVATAVSNGVDLEVIWFDDVIGSAEALVMRDDSCVKTVDEIHGKIATPFVSTAHFSLLSALSNGNADMSNIELLDMQPSDIYAAWSRGDIDGAYVWYPVLGQLINDGGVVITDSVEQASNGAMTADLIVVRKEFAEKYPQIVSDYIKARIDSVNEYKESTNTAVEKMAEVLGLSDSEIYEQVEGFLYLTGKEQLSADYLGDDERAGGIAKVLKDTADFLVSQGSIPNAPDATTFERVVNPDYLIDAMEGQ